MKIIFVRHGETNLKTGTLSKTGVRQIKAACKYLKNEKIDAIFCSPKTRAVQTANIIKAYQKAEVYIEKNLNERQILTPSQRLLYAKEFDENYLNYNYQSPNFETCKDFIDRNFEGFINILTLINPKVFKNIEDPLKMLKSGAINFELSQKEEQISEVISLSKSLANQTIAIVAHSSTLYALSAFINGIPQNGQITWLQCNNGAVVKFFI